MKKPIIIAGALVSILIIGAIATFAMFGSNQNTVADNGKSANTSGGSTFVAVDSCEILTQEIVDEALGSGAQKAAATTPTIYSDDLIVSNCIYSKDTDGIGLLIRSAKTMSGASDNKSRFNDQKPDNVETVDNLGDAAYYEPSIGQLNILAGNNWYILTVYEEQLTNTTLEANVEIARKLVLI